MGYERKPAAITRLTAFLICQPGFLVDIVMRSAYLPNATVRGCVDDHALGLEPRELRRGSCGGARSCRTIASIRCLQLALQRSQLGL